MLVIRHKNIVLRSIVESDIADWVEWSTSETEWTDWNAPWWKDDPGYCPKRWAEQLIQNRRRELVASPPDVHVRLCIETDCGRHIGSVSRATDLRLYSEDAVKGYDDKLKLGIVIPPVDARGKGYGVNALTLWMAYLFDKHGTDMLYTQTWSGNLPMVALAERVGFAEHVRRAGTREVRGKAYDAVGFSITKDDFVKHHGVIDLW